MFNPDEENTFGEDTGAEEAFELRTHVPDVEELMEGEDTELADDDGSDEPWDGFRDDVDADADALASAGWGTDDDYGG